MSLLQLDLPRNLRGNVARQPFAVEAGRAGTLHGSNQELHNAFSRTLPTIKPAARAVRPALLSHPARTRRGLSAQPSAQSGLENGFGRGAALAVCIMGDCKALNVLTLSSKVGADPAHVPRDLANDLV